MRFLDRFLPNFAISLSLGLIVLAVLNEFNPTMGFLISTVSKVYYAVLAVTVIIVAVRHLVLTRDE